VADLGGAPVAAYEFNGNGARAVKSTKLSTTWFMYDTAGRMIAELDAKDGSVLREYVYLGYQPIAVITRTVDKGASTGPGNGADKGIGKPVEPPKGPGHGKGTPPITAPGVPSVPETPSPAQPGVYFFHTDQVGAPQAVTALDGATVWQADWEPFGSVVIGQGKLTSHLRFPGQYFDEETSLHYNYYRHYDPQTGRYIESDPIGLRGGINTFAYVGADPIIYYDFYGLFIYGSGAPFPAEALGIWVGGWFNNLKCYLKSAYNFAGSYMDMQNATNWTGADWNNNEYGWQGQDKYFHCRANCEAAQLGPCGEDAADCISDARERHDRSKGDSAQDSMEDQTANMWGRQEGAANTKGDCRELCRPWRPGGSFPREW